MTSPAITVEPLGDDEREWETFLAGSNLVLPVYDWQGPNATYGNNRYFKPFLHLHEALQPTPLFRTGSWLLLAFAVCALAWRSRGGAAGAFAVAVSASAIVYVMTFLAVGVAADFRYGYWCVLATLAGAVAAVLARLERRSR